MQSTLACGFASLVAIAAGCSSKPLQDPNTGAGGGTIMTGAGGSIATGSGGSFWTDGGTIDGPWDAGFSGKRSFVVTSIVTSDGGPSLTHRFTMVFDADRRSAIVGASATSTTVGIQQVADGTFRFASTVGFSVVVPGTCTAYVSYDIVGFNLDAFGRLNGAGHGQLNTSQAESGNSVLVTTSLTGVADTVTPTLALGTNGSDIADPFSSVLVMSPEPLPVESSHAILRAAGGDVIGLTPYPENAGYVMGFMMPAAILLRYGETYTVDTDGLADFAGNRAAATNALTFNTKPPPPLVTADGFESITDATFGGAEVLSGAGAPTISGSRSLYIPPVLTGAPPTTQLALRIAIAPGNTVLRFSFRSVSTAWTSELPDSGANFKIASVGGSIVSPRLPDTAATGTSAEIDSTSVLLGPVLTATMNLPADATDEVVLARITQGSVSCGPPLALPPGLIIDDLRAE